MALLLFFYQSLPDMTLILCSDSVQASSFIYALQFVNHICNMMNQARFLAGLFKALHLYHLQSSMPLQGHHHK